LAALPEGSVDSVVTDPPYELAFMNRHWDAAGIANNPDLWRLVLRVLKPGGHLVAFGGTRTYHRMASAIEDAGFECRDALMYHYGSGFPKSLDVSKSLDKVAGAEREVMGVKARPDGSAPRTNVKASKFNGSTYAGDAYSLAMSGNDAPLTAPATDAAKHWQGWGTALKPATEIICLARKPLIGTVAANVLEHGTGALNIDGCRVEGEVPTFDRPADDRREIYADGLGTSARTGQTRTGRWPANLIHDGSEEVVGAFPENCPSGSGDKHPRKFESNDVLGKGLGWSPNPSIGGDSGSAARFFYTAKADAEDRLGSKHPTVKPLDLMQWLVRLVTPKGGMVLDPFAGTGTTGEAAWREGMRAILIEREPEYQADIARRMDLAVKPTKRAAVAKTKNQLERPEDLPLFNLRGEPAE
jgi:DNA modification methylase